MNLAELLTTLQTLDVKLRVENGELRVSAPRGVITPELADELGQRRDELIEALQAAGDLGAAERAPIAARPQQPDYPLTPAQERLWFVSRLLEDNSPYNLRNAFRLRGPLDADALEYCLGQLVERHASLRTTFSSVDGKPRQRVSPRQRLLLRREDLRQVAATQREQVLQQRMRQDDRSAFDLESGPLLRSVLYWLDRDDYVLSIVMHHIVTDGWSLALMQRELETLYRDRVMSTACELPPLPLQYTDYALWQQHSREQENLDKRLQYWRARLEDLPVLQLPTDRLRPATQSYRGADVSLTLPPDLRRALESLARQQGCTLFIILFSAFTLLLHRYSGQTDIVVGTPVANRGRAELEGLVGFFVNMLVLRSDLSGDPTLLELMQRIRTAVLEDFENQDVAFEKLVDELQPERDLSRSPLFQVVFSLQDAELTRLALEGLEVSSFSSGIESTRFDFEAHVRPEADGLFIRFVYNPDLFDEDRVARMAGHYASILESLARDPAQRLSGADMLSAGERRFLLDEINRTQVPYAKDLSVVARVERQASTNPAAVAVVGDDEVDYAELNRRANRLAALLLENGAGKAAPVAICLARSVDMVVAQLAVLKTGSAYVPIDPEYPAERISLILEDTRAQILLTHTAVRDRVSSYPGLAFCVDSDSQRLPDDADANPDIPIGADDLAYVMYTSGSSGTPKGVEVTHGGLANLVSWHNRVYEVSAEDRATHLAGLGFDASVWELWPYLCAGASVHLVPDAERLSPSALYAWLARCRITLTFLPTPLAEAVLQEAVPGGLALRCLLTGGDRLHRGLVDADLPFRVVNHYGPTENTVVATSAEVDFGSALEPPIGRPIDNVRVRILDSCQRPVPIGVAGELYIGGDSLARGYLNQPGLTAEKFVTVAVDGAGPERLYRTGDIACYRADGDIEFIGRVDHQVKLRGFRIELGEIEAILARRPDIESAAVLMREDEPGNRRLVAYLVAAADHALETGEIRDHLQASLPAFMLPSAFVIVDEMPLNRSGKVDRDALPAPASALPGSASVIAPRNDIERGIAEIWRQVLHLDDLSVHDNFFSLGGNSLLLAEVHEKVSQAFERDFSILELFRYPSISQLAAFLADAKREPEKTASTQPRRPNAGAQAAEPIAIIGMNGRFPGAGSVEQFWLNLRRGVESIRHFSRDELLEKGVDEALLDNPDYVPAVSSVDDVDLFDARFFGYSPRQAQIMDPQHRIFLECAWELMERAGYDCDHYPGRVGVYGGASVNEYANALLYDPELARSYTYLDTAMGNDKDFLATRISYNLNISGPGITVQTSCSTSLVATHLAIQGLRGGDCDMAIVGGSTIRNYDANGYLYQDGGIVSPDGHCRAFDAEARGTVGGDGTALVLLKRLADALEDGDQIYALIKGSASNNDGSQKTGYTAPSVQGQARVIGDALRQAGVEPRSISYVEAHGTATALGDPIEIAALTQAFRRHTDDRQFCGVGSVKTNVGHLESAAGVTGLIKTALAMWHGQIPPSLNFSRPNPEIDFENSPFYVNAELKSWERGDTPRRAGVSSFGIGGTNAHLVLEEAPPIEASAAARDWQLLLLSAKTAPALEQMTDNLCRYLQQDREVNLADVAFTLQTGRKAFKYRRALVCRDVADAIDALQSRDIRRLTDSLAPDSEYPTVFMFSGQGSQYPGMGLDLYRYQPRYRETVDHCCDLLSGHVDFDLREILYPQGRDLDAVKSRLDHTAVAQCALFVTEYALARLWMSWGVQPRAMIGHSIGEYAAACLAGVMPLETALEVVATRGRLMGELPRGSMLAVMLSEDEIRPRLGGNLEIATVNGLQMCAVSGPDEAIKAFAGELADEGIQAQGLCTSHAFHSAMMEGALQPFTECLQKFELHPPSIPYISNLSGNWIGVEEATSPAYYAAQLRHTVRFADGLERILDETGCQLLEIGPGNTLTGLAKLHPARQATHAVVSSLRHATDDKADECSLWQAVAGLWLAGVRLDWVAVHGGQRRHRILLPTYPFERQHFWLEAGTDARLALAADKTATAPFKIDDPAQWCYLPCWKSSPTIDSAASRAESYRGKWLIFLDHGGVGERLAAGIAESGGDVVRIFPGEVFETLEAGAFRLNPANPEDYRRLLTEAGAGDAEPAHVVHCWGLGGDSGRDLDAALTAGYYSLLYLAQALMQRWPVARTAFDVVTNNVHSVTGSERLCPPNAFALGLCRVLRIEYPTATFRTIDIELQADGEPDPRLPLQALQRDLVAADGQIQLAYRNFRRWLPEYQKVDGGDLRQQPRLRQQGVYLVTGGLGNVGLALAEYLARTVNARLILTARSALPPRESWDEWQAQHEDDDAVSSKIRRLQSLQALGAELMITAVDVADRGQMQNMLEQAERRFGAVHGVIHAAGVVAGPSLDLVQNLDREACELQFRPKVHGLLVLRELFAERAVDFIMPVSSISTVLGGLTFAAYAAANHYMDVLSRQQFSHGDDRWISVDWDGWEFDRQVLESRAAGSTGSFALTAAEGSEVFGRVLRMGSIPRVIISTGDLQGRIEQWSKSQDSADYEQDQADVETAAASARPALASDYVAPRNETEEKLAQIWQQALGIDQIGVDDNFFELGGDSVMNIQITAMAKQAGLALTPRDAFEHQTIAELALAAGAAGDGATRRQGEGRVGAPAAAADISDADLSEILRQQEGL